MIRNQPGHSTDRLKTFFIQFIVWQLYILIISISGISAQDPDTLNSEKLVELGDVSVIGQRNPSVFNNRARKITIITRDEIESSPASTIQDLLEYASGVDIRQRNVNGVQADIQIRGGSFDQVMVLLNGVNISDPQTGHFNLDLPVELSSIERIEILHGTGARVYGANAYKGVINIITKKDTDMISAGIKYGQYNLLQTNISGGIKSGNLFNSLSFSRNSSSGYTKNTDYDMNQVFYEGGLTFKTGVLSWQGGTGNKAFGANDFYSPRYPEQYEETSSGFASVALKKKGKINYSFAGYWRRHNDHFLLKRENPSFYENFHKTDVFGLKGNADFSTFLGKTALGFEIRDEMILSNRLGDLLSSPVKINREDSAFYSKSFNRATFSYFLEHNYITGNFSFTAGILLDHSNNFKGETGLYPGMDISYKFLKKNGRLFLSINKSLRRPTFTDMFYEDPSNEGNRDLEPEELLAFEAGSDLKLGNYSAGVTLFSDYGKKVIDWVWQADRNLYKAMNIAEIDTRGLEISANYINNDLDKTLEVNTIGASFSAISLTKVTGDFISKYSLDFLKYKFKFHADFNFTRSISANMQVGYFSRNGTYLDYSDTSGLTSEIAYNPYWLTDIRLSYRNRAFRFNIEVTNLLNTMYTDIGNLIQAGRWITAGVQFTLSGKK